MENKRKFLIPLDKEFEFKGVCALCATVASMLRENVDDVALAYVIGGTYLAEHVKNVDLRAQHVMESDLFKNLRQQHIKKDIEPMLEKAREIIKRIDPSLPLRELILEGNPVTELVHLIKGQGYSTVFIQRRVYDNPLGAMLGSIPAGIIHARVPVTVYLPGIKIENGFPWERPIPLNHILVPVDGSEDSLAAVTEAASLVAASSDSFCITLLHVLNLEEIPAEMDASWLKEKGREILQETSTLLKGKVKDSVKIETELRIGMPAETIAETANELDADMIIIGRKGRRAIGEIIVGSVGLDLLRKNLNPALVLVNA